MSAPLACGAAGGARPVHAAGPSLSGGRNTVNLCPDIRAAGCAIIAGWPTPRRRPGAPTGTPSSTSPRTCRSTGAARSRCTCRWPAQLEALVRSERLPAGSRLTTEVQLADRLGISRPTVRAAIGSLVDRGLLVRKRGVGTQVVARPAGPAAGADQPARRPAARRAGTDDDGPRARRGAGRPRTGPGAAARRRHSRRPAAPAAAGGRRAGRADDQPSAGRSGRPGRRRRSRRTGCTSCCGRPVSGSASPTSRSGRRPRPRPRRGGSASAAARRCSRCGARRTTTKGDRSSTAVTSTAGRGYRFSTTLVQR